MSTPKPPPPAPEKPEASKPGRFDVIRAQLGSFFQKRPWVPVLLGLVVMLAIGYWSYDAWQKAHWLTFYGNVDIRETNLGFRVFGKLEKVLKDEGDPVCAGDLLAVLDNEPSTHAYNQALSEMETRKAAADNARTNFERAESLVGTRGISKEEYDNFKAQNEQAAAQFRLSEAKLAEADTNLKDTRMVSPVDGVVITRAQESGTILQPGTTVLTVSLEKPVWVRAYINEPDLGEIHPGMEVGLYTDTRPDHLYHGQVGYISPRAEFTPKSVETADLRTSLVYRLRIIVLDPDPSLRQGMPVTVRIRRK